MRLRRLTLLLIAVALIAAACSDGPATDAAATPASPEGGPNPVVELNEPRVGSDIESALRGDRTHPSFPDALIPLDRIRSGGPPPDGIPPIDEPDFVSVAAAS